MSVTLDDDISEGSDEEEEEEGEEEQEREETALAVASIENEQLAPSLGDEFSWDEVLELQNALEKERAAEGEVSSLEELTSPQKVPSEITKPTTPTDVIQQTTCEQSLPTHQVLTPAYGAQTQNIIQLKDSLSRVENSRQDLLKQLEKAKHKISILENQQLKTRQQEEDLKIEEEALKRARKVLDSQLENIERRENAVKEVDKRIQKEKRELWQEREEMKAERGKIESEKKKITEENAKILAREEDLRMKDGTLRKFFEQVKKQRTELKSQKSLIHVPIRSNKIVGDPKIQSVSNTTQQCFGEDIVCGHLKVKHQGELTLLSWVNRIVCADLTNAKFESDSDGEHPPTKRAKTSD